MLANHLLGSMYFHQGTLDLAIERYRRALGDGAAVRPLRLRPGGRLVPPGEHARGDRRLPAVPGDRPPLQRRPLPAGRSALFHAGELDEALEQFERCTTLTPEYVMARYHIGVIHERRGDVAAAAREFEHSMAEGVGEVAASTTWRQIRRGQGRTNEAEALLERRRQFGRAQTR